jgi:hypothetical protein
MRALAEPINELDGHQALWPRFGVRGLMVEAGGLLNSISRFAMLQSEIGPSGGEPLAAKGPPSSANCPGFWNGPPQAAEEELIGLGAHAAHQRGSRRGHSPAWTAREHSGAR